MPIINGYRVTSNGGRNSGAHMQIASIRVRKDGLILGEIKLPEVTSKPLWFLQRRPRYPARIDLENQLRENGVSEKDIESIFELPLDKRK